MKSIVTIQFQAQKAICEKREKCANRACGSLFHRLSCGAANKKALARLLSELRVLLAAQTIVAHSAFRRPSHD